MQINFTGHHVEVTKALQNLVESKFTKIKRHFDNITSAHVVFEVENKQEKKVEATIHIPGHQLHASSKSDDMYKAIDKMIEALDKQVIKHKEKMTDHHRGENHREQD